MSISSQITRIQDLVARIRTKLIELGLAQSGEKLLALTEEIENIENHGQIAAEIKEGESYTIGKGYHIGGTVTAVKGGGDYKLQAKSATPTKSSQSITADTGYYGLSKVEIAAIPSNYQDVSSVTATAGDVLLNKIIVTSDGTVTTGTMANNGVVTKTMTGLTDETKSVTLEAGYYATGGTVSLTNDIETLLEAI